MERLPAPLPPTAAPPLAAGAVHVWRLPWHPERAQRDRTLVAALARYLPDGMPVHLEREPGGRPVLRGAPDALHFGVSHTGDRFFVAIARVAIGIDLERLGRRRRYREIAAQYFAPEELADLDRDGEAGVERRFLTSWVAKEALLKANGMGIAGGLRQLWIDASDDDAPVLRRAPAAFGDASAWCVRWFTPDAASLAAIASAGVCGELVHVDAR